MKRIFSLVFVAAVILMPGLAKADNYLPNYQAGETIKVVEDLTFVAKLPDGNLEFFRLQAVYVDDLLSIAQPGSTNGLSNKKVVLRHYISFKIGADEYLADTALTGAILLLSANEMIVMEGNKAEIESLLSGDLGGWKPSYFHAADFLVSAQNLVVPEPAPEGTPENEVPAPPLCTVPDLNKAVLSSLISPHAQTGQGEVKVKVVNSDSATGDAEFEIQWKVGMSIQTEYEEAPVVVQISTDNGTGIFRYQATGRKVVMAELTSDNLDLKLIQGGALEAKGTMRHSWSFERGFSAEVTEETHPNTANYLGTDPLTQPLVNDAPVNFGKDVLRRAHEAGGGLPSTADREPNSVCFEYNDQGIASYGFATTGGAAKVFGLRLATQDYPNVATAYSVQAGGGVLNQLKVQLNAAQSVVTRGLGAAGQGASANSMIWYGGDNAPTTNRTAIFYRIQAPLKDTTHVLRVIAILYGGGANGAGKTVAFIIIDPKKINEKMGG
ncbi:MAG: hypothetical protein NUW37_03120 [Planctomycetes bacterium]|nr:hypothetical protein [Planctomycetota bacterium]